MEFASMQVQGGKVVDTYEELFAVADIPPNVQTLTHIRPADLADKPAFLEKKDAILEHIGTDTLIVGQNIQVDLGMLKGEGLDLTERPWVDTSMLASLVFPELASYSLGYLSEALDLNHEPKHRALGDVQATLELLAACWERLQELTPEFDEVARIIASKSTPGYKMLFETLPKSTKKRKKPRWLALPKEEISVGAHAPITLPTPALGEVQLVEESLDPLLLEQLIASCIQDKTVVHWIAVKNLESTLARVRFADKDVRILYPPFLLPDKDAAKKFAEQETYTADEATLALKLVWYEPDVQSDFPLHGGEEAGWNGKIASTATSESYTKQFKKLPTVILLDHRQLLEFLAEPEHAAHGALTKDTHIVITDASMLEDAATKAYGWRVSMDDLRATAQGDPLFTKVMDVLQLWVERVRQFQDMRYIVPNDLGSPETKGLREQVMFLKKEGTLTTQALKQMDALEKILDPDNLQNRIVWIEQHQNGSQYLHSVPERIGNFLAEHLYGKFPTSLLIPPGSAATLRAILPAGTKTALARPMFEQKPLVIDIPEQGNIDSYFTHPPEGKTILLIPSKGAISDLYVKYADTLEKAGVTMICQGMSGGQGRMQAEFTVSKDPALWLLTPWSFEGLQLPALSVDHLIIKTLPFDHPSHAILSKRAAQYRDPFEEYVLARLEHRVFRILRTYARFRRGAGYVIILDDRLRSKEYGKRVRAYLQTLSSSDAPEPAGAAPKKKTKKKKDQLSLF